MRNPYGVNWIGTILLLGAVSLAGCGAAPDASHTGRGVIQDMDVAKRKVTIDHEDIPGFMRAMTMTFAAGEGVELDGLSPGKEVEFRVKLEGGQYIVTSIEATEP